MNSMGIKNYSHVEFYVGSAKMTAYWFAKAFGLKISGYKGPESGHREACSYLLERSNIRIVVTSPLGGQAPEITQFLNLHGDGVKRFALLVEDVKTSFKKALLGKAIPVKAPHILSDGQGQVESASIRLYDDSELVFFDNSRYSGIFEPGFIPPLQKNEIHCEDTGLEFIDHIVGNVRTNEMDRWADYFNQALDFETFINFGPGDISTRYSALLSKVVRSRDETIKNPINEPYDGLKKSQIDEFLQEYKGSGIQHIAIHTSDIVKSIRALRRNGMEFLSVPHTYYEALRKKNFPIRENIDDLQKEGILCDTEGGGYLLQLFTKPISDRPTFFFEIIQRCGGAKGFGQGNFQALFESIERDQELRGNLTDRN